MEHFPSIKIWRFIVNMALHCGLNMGVCFWDRILQAAIYTGLPRHLKQVKYKDKACFTWFHFMHTQFMYSDVWHWLWPWPFSEEHGRRDCSIPGPFVDILPILIRCLKMGFPVGAVQPQRGQPQGDPLPGLASWLGWASWRALCPRLTASKHSFF